MSKTIEILKEQSRARSQVLKSSQVVNDSPYYHQLKEEITEIEKDIKRLESPLGEAKPSDKEEYLTPEFARDIVEAFEPWHDHLEAVIARHQEKRFEGYRKGREKAKAHVLKLVERLSKWTV